MTELVVLRRAESDLQRIYNRLEEFLRRIDLAFERPTSPTSRTR